MKDSLKIIAVIIGFIIIVTGLSLGTGYFGNFYKSTVIKQSVDIDREIFEKSKSHIKGMADDLAKYKYEYETSKDDISKQAIRDLIVDRFADFDVNDLNNPSLRSFLIRMRGF